LKVAKRSCQKTALNMTLKTRRKRIGLTNRSCYVRLGSMRRIGKKRSRTNTTRNRFGNRQTVEIDGTSIVDVKSLTSVLNDVRIEVIKLDGRKRLGKFAVARARAIPDRCCGVTNTDWWW